MPVYSVNTEMCLLTAWTCMSSKYGAQAAVRAINQGPAGKLEVTRYPLPRWGKT